MSSKENKVGLAKENSNFDTSSQMALATHAAKQSGMKLRVTGKIFWLNKRNIFVLHL